MSVRKIHHINFLVHNLERGIHRYRQMLGIGDFLIETLPGRGVITARASLGESWLVLVQPIDDKGIPARYLAKHGEGFFLISFGVDDLNAAVAKVATAGYKMTSERPRAGLENWEVWDIESIDALGVQIQLCKDSK